MIEILDLEFLSSAIKKRKENNIKDLEKAHPDTQETQLLSRARN